MLFAFDCQIAHGPEALARATTRYAFLKRLQKAATRRNVQVLAFAMGDEAVRLVLDGHRTDVGHVVRGTKSGTCRALRNDQSLLLWGTTHEHMFDEDALEARVAWCHALVEGPPLASPWTSHRDLMGFRTADFFDADALRARVRPMQVHALAGGRALPEVGVDATADRLDTLLRAAAAVVGVLPANRRCFRLFVHLARAQGFKTPALARALMLTGRRIRQLAQDGEPLLPVAQAHLADARLANVP